MADSMAEKRLREQLAATYRRRRTTLNMVHYIGSFMVMAAATAIVAATTVPPTPISKCSAEQREYALNIVNQTISLS